MPTCIKGYLYDPLMLVLVIFPASFVFSQPRPFERDTFPYTVGVVEEIAKARFGVSFDADKIDSSLITFIKRRERINCIANPKKQFNSTDVRYQYLCNFRLLFWGKSIDKKYSFIVCQEGTETGIEVSSYLFKHNGTLISGGSKVGLYRKLRTFKQFVTALRTKQYRYNPPNYLQNDTRNKKTAANSVFIKLWRDE